MNLFIKLEGDGQCSCYGCEQKHGWNSHWTSMCYECTDGHIYCNSCKQDMEATNKEPSAEDTGTEEE